MAGKEYKVVITAEDKATQTVRRVNAAFSKLTEPLDRISGSMSTFSQATGLEKVTGRFGELARSAGEAASRIAGVATPLGVIGSAASIAGVVSYAAQWGRAGTEIKHAAQSIGIATGALQELQGAARLAGLSKEDATGGLMGVATALNDAVAGRNPELSALLASANINMDKFRGAGQIGRFKQLSDAVESLSSNPQAQQTLLNGVGAGANMLPLFSGGGAQLESLLGQARATGAVQSDEAIQQASELNKGFTALQLSIEGVNNRIATNIGFLGDWAKAASKVIAEHQGLSAVIASAGYTAAGIGVLWGAGKFLAKAGILASGAGAAAAGVAAPAAVAGGNAFRAGVLATGGMGVGGLGVLGAAAVGTTVHRGYGLYQDYQAHNAEVDVIGSGIAGALMDRANGASSDRILSPSEPSGILLNGAPPGSGSGSVQVEVTFKDAPSNLRANTTTKGAVRANTNIGYSMPTDVSP